MSKTIWGAGISILSTVFGLTQGEQAFISEAITQIVSVAGGLFAIYGRIVAKDQISGLL